MKQKLLLLLFIPAIAFSQTKLSKAKKSLSHKSKSTGTSQTSSSSGSSTSRSNNNDDDDYPFSGLVGQLVYNLTLGIGFGQAKYTEVNPYPYFNGDGEYTRNYHNSTQRTNFRIGTNYLFNNVRGLEVNALFKPIPIAGLEVSHVNFYERSLFGSESLNITSLQANYYRFREKNFTLWWGIGATYVGNEVNRWGFAYNLGTEIYPVKPISLHIGWKQSFINEKSVDVFKAHAKYHLKKTALYTGYHNYKLGSETVSGLVFGIEYTF